MLRISMSDDVPMAILKIEGKLVGPWATELGTIWHELWASARRRPLRLDLREVTYVDSNGASVLREIVRVTGAEVFADSPLTQYFAKQAKSENAPEPIEEG